MAVKYPNAKQFSRDLDSGRLDGIYLFLGEEEGEKDKFINRIIDMAFSDDNERSLCTGRFHIENDELMEAADFAMSGSMFYPTRLCIMYNIESLKEKSAESGLFNELMDTIPDSTRIIMTTGQNRPPGIIRGQMLKKIKVVQFWRYFDNDIYNYIHYNIKKLGLTIDDRALEMLLDLTGKDIKKIDDALEMIQFSGERGVITEEVISSLISDVRDVSIFEFIDSLFKREKKSLKLFRKIFDDGVPELRILYMIQNQAEKLEKYYYHTEGGMSSDDAMKECGIFSRNTDNFWRYIRQFPREAVKKIFLLISSADYKIKSGGLIKEIPANPVFNLVSDILFDEPGREPPQ